MDVNWMGRYRTLVMALVQHCNISARGSGIKDRVTDDIWLNAHEWQVLEYIIEHTEDDAYMNRMSEVLGLPQSSFSRSVSLLSSYGLVEKYQTESNRKNVLLRPTRRKRGSRYIKINTPSWITSCSRISLSPWTVSTMRPLRDSARRCLLSIKS